MTAVLKNGLAPLMHPRIGGGYSSLVEQGYDVYALLGQSNMIGRADIRAGIDDDYSAIAGRVFQFGYNAQTVSAATNPLDHVNEVAGDMGLWLEFVKAILPTMPENRNILLVPASQGGTSAINWVTGGTLHNAAVARMNAAMSQGSGVNQFMGGNWLQGETDADSAVSQATYKSRIQAIHQGFIDGVTAWQTTTPFVMGTIKPDKSGAPAINAALAEYAAENSAVSLIDLTDLSWYDSDHYTAASLATAGQRYASIY